VRTSAVFVMPPGGVISHFSEHLGTGFLRTMLMRAGIPSQQYLPAGDVSLATFARFLDQLRPAVVGFTAYETNLRACRAMTRVVRETLPEAVVMVGGPNATFSPEETLDLLKADMCLRGAGEGTIVAIVQAILGADRSRHWLPDLLVGIPNLVFRTPNCTRSTRTGDLSSFPGEYFRCLDDIPSPYQAEQFATADVGFLTARGCNQQCTYCSFATISGRRIHYHGVDRVLEDLAAFKPLVDRVERRSPSIAILDDAFTLAPERARAICEGIIARGLQMPFECATRADRVDAHLLGLMKRAGFVEVGFGLESAVPRVLRAIGKVQEPATHGDPGFDAERAYLEKFRRAVADAKEAGLSPSVSVIGGLPVETADDFRATLAFVDSLGVSFYRHNVLAVLPGTPLYQDQNRYGLRASRQTSGLWRTQHAYDVGSVRPLKNSSIHDLRWEEANRISDALCGRPRSTGEGGDAAWAIVLHGNDPTSRLASWLPSVLAVHGAVIVVRTAPSCSGADCDSWIQALDRADVPWGLLALLSPDGVSGDPGVLRSFGTEGEHRFRIGAQWSSTRCAIEADEDGNCCVPIWVASGSVAPPPRVGEDVLWAATPQIADGCRWWAGGRRCRRPRMLHVWPDSIVRACWHGPAIGMVGAAYPDLVSRGEALVRAPSVDRCPLGRETEYTSGAASVVGQYEVAARMEWLFRRQADSR